MNFRHFLLASALAALPIGSRAEHVTVMGDSLTKEYEITFPGLPVVGVEGIDADNPSARNWIEILHLRRNAHFDLGQFRNSLFNRWADFRLLGHEYNWAVPGATARALRNLATGQDLAEITSDPDFALFITFAPEWQQTTPRLLAQAQTTAAAVIWCGGNDLRFGNTDPAAASASTPITYQTIYDGNGTGAGNPQPLMDSIRSSIQAVALTLKSARPNLPIAVFAVPHIGCAPVVREDAPTDAVRTGRLTTALTALNAELEEWTESTLGGAWVDIFTLTRDLIEHPFDIGGVSFQTAADPLTAADPPTAHHRYLFAQDGFHSGMAAQARVAQLAQAALREKFPAVFSSSPPLTDREIITDVLGLAVSTGFTEFMTDSGAPSGQRGPADDPDRDGLPNLTEFAIAGNNPFPGGPRQLPVAGVDPGGSDFTLTWMPRFASNVFCTLTCEQSTDCAAWSEVPAGGVTTNPDGSVTARVPATAPVFLRLKISVTP